MYRKTAGSLIYLTITRLDLSYAIEFMSQFMKKPCKGHLDAIQRVLRYVKFTCMYVCSMREDKALPCMDIQILIGLKMPWIGKEQLVM